MTDQNQNWVWDVIYSPFGAVSYMWGIQTTMDLRFPGQWFQLENGLAYNWHRHYDPTIGRYIEPDPLGLQALLSDGPSVYNYVGGNPLAYVDPDGRQVGAVAEGAGAICRKFPAFCAAIIATGARWVGQKASQYCGKSGSGDPCKDFNDKVYDAINVIRNRIDDSLEDKLDLYNQAYDTPNSTLPPGSGTWVGHLQQIQNWQQRLRTLIRNAPQGCPIPNEAYYWATRAIHTQPRGN
jgi:RHS repeat-associated protein